MKNKYLRNLLLIFPFLPLVAAGIGLFVSHRIGVIAYCIAAAVDLVAAASPQVTRLVERFPKSAFVVGIGSWLIAAMRIGFFWGKVCA